MKQMDMTVGADTSALAERLALSLHQAADMGALWRELKRLATVLLPCHSISIYRDYLSAGNKVRLLHHAFVDTRLQPWELRQKVTPTRQFLQEHAGIRLFQLTQMVPDDRALKASDYYKQVIIPEGWGTLACLVFWRSDEPAFMIVLRTPPDVKRLSAETVDLLYKLHPQLEVALQRVESVERDHAVWSALKPLVYALPFGAAVFEPGGRCLFQNVEFSRLLNLWCGLPADLVCDDPHLPTLLREGFDAACAEASPAMVSGPHGLSAVISVLGSQISRLTVLVRLKQAVVMEEIGSSQPCLLLTPTERVIAQGVARGEDNKAIAVRLGRSLSTVKTHLTAIFRKLNCATRAQLIVMMQTRDKG